MKFKAVRYNTVVIEIPLAQDPWLKFHTVITVRMLLCNSECCTLKEGHMRRMGTTEVFFFFQRRLENYVNIMNVLEN
jgi:hypothetical protein